ncbi:23S rRNA (adenine(2030)-N(6))-methyltransferase RlmJ [Pseudopelagicola sp. nBUS_19]|uniref:23S rRNA (adenine(2030)-N(6))-methyltransferase RlmJ n=1 Tax=Pseudopelagicola sp. nBUS_19 TaxID=3395316 RepID=UPI003EB8E3C4
MLSYQHIYHAGNLADVQKHALLAWMLHYMVQKPKPLTYIETHAGRGLYQLNALEAIKTGESAAGIGIASPWFESEHPYFRAIETVRGLHGEAAYPGSPALAAGTLRAEDRIVLSELHPKECAALRVTMRDVGAKIFQNDGFKIALDLCPPTPRRGLILIDPSYEIKMDYALIPDFVKRLNRRWNVGVIALWYPILRDETHIHMLKALEALGLPNIFRHEVNFPPVRDGHRMVGSGMFIVNAPFGIAEEASRLSGHFAKLAG